ncbi:hypothetical protein BDN72DRAFT_961010 [Pluteus cervinus]|uniref:Uncharacterized protein n=1 Tax=Pluteus cervinus TaxID=181527 RepID=A0ACD3AQ29_9AGAR|nr:hypothetical protein BDN72DRAFT_961010 [Pluteus cervinus]
MDGHQSSAIYRAFSEPKIFDLILLSTQHASFRASVFYSIARTCRLFFLPSIKYTWTTCSSLLSLLKTLPSDSWLVEERNGPHRVITSFTLTRRITREDCERLRIYAGFMLWMLHASFDAVISEDVFYALSEIFGPGTLTPCLEYIHWSVFEDPFFPAYTLFAHHNLKRFGVSLGHGIRNSTTTRGRLAMLANLHTLCPNLTSLRLYDSEDPSLVALASPMIVGFSHLQSLDIPCVSMEVFMHLMGLESLQDLKLGRLDNIEWDSVRQWPHSAVSFSNLTKIAIGPMSLATCSAMLELMNPTLRVLRVVMEGICHPDEWSTLCVAIQKSCFSSNLHTLDLSDLPTALATGDIPQISIGHIQPLLTCSGLHEFQFLPLCGLGFSDDDVSIMAQAFPCLQSLTLMMLGPELTHPPPNRLTIASLVHLAKVCPNIGELQLSLDSSSPTLAIAKDALQGLPPRVPKWVYPMFLALKREKSPIDDPRAVAAFLIELFPALVMHKRGSESTGADESEDARSNREKWDKVQEIVSEHWNRVAPYHRT